MDITDDVAVSDDHAVLLRPRPFAKSSGRLILLPLLPQRPTIKPLPTEVWTRILGHVIADYDLQKDQHPSGSNAATLKRDILLVCKTLKDVALPMYYAKAHISSPPRLMQFTEVLHAADQQWDSIRRIPYSTPGRWVQALDISCLRCNFWSDVCQVDALLARLFPLLPFLSRLTLNSTLVLSRRAVESLCSRDGNHRITSLQGVKLASSADVSSDDPFLDILRHCPNLEELEFYGSGIEPLLTDHSITLVEPDTLSIKPLQLPRLRRLAIISTHCSPVMFSLLKSPLPSLNHLTVTPYDDVSIPSSLVPRFIETHGAGLTSLHLYAPKSWPTMLFPSPTTLLHTCPKLNHLSLENPLPILTICSIYPKHPLQILSIPRPDARFLTVLESLLPKLPALRAVRTRDVRWLRAGMSSHAREAGVQGEMRDWRHRLARRGIAVLDATWAPSGS